jgi:hypothetical protein
MLLLNRKLMVRDLTWLTCPSGECASSIGMTRLYAPRILGRFLSFSEGSVNIVQRVLGF